MDQRIIRHFQQVDQKLYAIAQSVTVRSLTVGDDPFSDLCNAIVCQQLSDKAGTAIWNRFVRLFPDGKPTPPSVLGKTEEQLRTSGISTSKAHYIRAVATAFTDGIVDPRKFPAMTDGEIIQSLQQIKGVGRWTAEMFLMFSLGREDVFSSGDLGLRKALQHLFNLKQLPEERWIERTTKRWSPYRTYAALLLWKHLDTPKPPKSPANKKKSGV